MAKASMRGFIKGFTLIEMMIVLVILIIVIAIVVPALSGARNRAKQVVTLQLHTSLGSASAQYELSERRLPGYFSPADMGAVANETQGLSNMENIVLDLAGGVTTAGATGAIMVGPSPTNQVPVRIDQIDAPVQVKGVTHKGYWVPDKKNFVAMTGQIGTAEHITLPDVVDAFGNPMLVWVQDESPATTANFAAQNSTTPARFFWAGNACFLNSGKLGKSEANQVSESMLSLGNGPPQLVQTMTALLGNPAFPKASVTPDAPSASRGKLVFHSAGPDGVFMSSKDRGGKVAGGFGMGVQYRANKDVMNDFDDVVTWVAN